MQPYGNELAKFLQNKLGSRNKEGFGGEYLQIDEHMVQGCAHECCHCQLVIRGLAPHFEGLVYYVSVAYINEDLAKFFAYLQTTYKLTDNNLIVRASGNYVLSDLRARLTRSSPMTLIEPPFHKVRAQAAIPSSDVSTTIRRILRNADEWYVRWTFPHIHIDALMWNHVWQDTEEIPSLMVLCLRTRSIYRQLTDSPKGRKIVLSAMDNLEGDKMLSSLMKIQKQAPGVREHDKYLFSMVPRALDIVYNMLDTRHLIGTERIKFGFHDLDGMYLGASAGVTEATEVTIKGEISDVRVTASGKKYEVHQADIEAILLFLEDVDHEPAVNWTVSFKNEHYYHYRPSRYTDEQWAQKMAKVRTFMIPSSVLIIAERLVSKFRMHVERGKIIRIGQSWVNGGADWLAKILGVDESTAYLPQMCEGDVDGLDVSVSAKWIELYLTNTLIYDDSTAADYAARKRVTIFLIKNICVKLLHLYSTQWAGLEGVVPSGCLNTSHMDSFILLVWWVLFVLHVLSTLYDSDPEAAIIIEEKVVLTQLIVVIYGDDHLWNKTMDPRISAFINETNFTAFCKKYLNVEIRDILDGVPFCSTVKDGRIINRGATFLKHQFVVNPYKESFCVSGKQPTFLPFRETWEFLVRCVYGKEEKRREPLDIVLSSIGHAYGTYASNRDAYIALKAINRAAIDAIGMRPGQLPADVLNLYSEDDFRDLRRKGLSTKELLCGFPSWDTLVMKNLYDPLRHINTLDGHMDSFPQEFEVGE